MVRMTALKIVDKILKDIALIDLNYDNKCWFEMYVCETHSNKGHKWDSKSIIKYNRLDVKDNKILLCNSKWKVIKTLSRENIVWIDKVYLCDKHIKVLVSDLNFVEMENNRIL